MPNFSEIRSKECMIRLLPVILIFCFSACDTPERDCNRFKTGTFEFETLVGTEVKKTRFVRNDTLEVDYYDNKIDTFTVRWVNDCEYVMKKLKPKNQAEKEAILFKILSTEGSNYTFEYSKLIQKKNTKKIVKRGTAVKTGAETLK